MAGRGSPYRLKVLLENLLRNEDGKLVSAEQVNALSLGSLGRGQHGDPVLPRRP